jgi:hypothetical protein
MERFNIKPLHKKTRLSSSVQKNSYPKDRLLSLNDLKHPELNKSLLFYIYHEFFKENTMIFIYTEK